MIDESTKKAIRKLKIIYKTAFYTSTAIFIIVAVCHLIFADYSMEYGEIIAPVISYALIYVLIGFAFNFIIQVKISMFLTNDVNTAAYCMAMRECLNKRALKKFEPQLDLIEAYYGGDFEKAKVCAAQLLTSRDKRLRFSAYNTLTRVASMQNDLEAAKRNCDFLRSEKYSPKCDEAICYADAFVACLEGQTDKAVNIIETTRSTGKGNFDLMALSSIKGTVYFYAGRYDDALSHLSVAKTLGVHTFVAEHCDSMIKTILAGKQGQTEIHIQK